MDAQSFDNLGISDDILQSLRRMKFETPTEVQALTIAPFATGADLLVQAPTGTGKTAAFGIPLIQKIDKELQGTQALILCPTRELAMQIATVMRSIAQCRPWIRIATIYGGESMAKQLAKLHHTPHIVVATPGRLMDHLQRRTINLHAVRTVVLDEADRLLDMGFRRDMEKILAQTPQSRQTVMFSATMPQEVYIVAGQFQQHTEEISVEQQSAAVDLVKQYYTVIGTEGKNEALYARLKANNYPLSLVFVNMKHRAARLATQLQKQGIRADALHGDMNQSQRDRVMGQYRLGKLEVLVATDVAARGIDVKNIDAVINFDIPMDDESYVHRIGRTGRAQQAGLSYTFVLEDEADRLRKMIKMLRLDITPTEDSPPLPEPVAPPPPSPGSKPKPRSFRSFGGRGRGGRRTTF